MKSSVFILFLLCGLIIALAFQSSGVLTVGGIAPNVVLVLLVGWAIVSRDSRFFLLSLSLFFLVVVVMFRFWVLEFALLSLSVIALFFAKRAITGSPFLDFLVAIVFTTLAVYFLLSLRAFHLLFPLRFFGELLYNVLAGALLWGFFSQKKLFSYHE